MGVSRRGFLGGTATAVSVAAFDEATRGWLSPAEAQRGRGTRVPHLDGELTFDPSALAEAADDFGNLVRRTPWAVLRPGSARDVVRMVRFANRHRLKVAVKGQGHSVFGQAMTDGGVVVDSRTLNGMYEMSRDSVWADAGVVWRDLVEATTARGLTPRVLTDYLGLSVGGVLSVGGMGGATQRFGMVCDNVLELEVVTGDGRHVRCSPHRRRGLFRAVLGGLGQFALILRARIRLTRALPFARIYQLVYPALGPYLADQRRVVADERFDFLEGQIVPAPEGGWLYVMEAGAWYDPARPPDDAALTADLSPIPGSTTTTDLPYVAWANRVDQFVAFWRANGLWDTPHPWSDIFLPDGSVETVVADVVSRLTPQDVGAGVTLLYPFKRGKLRSPFVRVPDDDVLWLFDILRFPTPDPTVVAAQLADNRRIFEQARDAGGKRYPISAVEMSGRDWVQHYGGAWFFVLAAKARFDPRNTLTPGQGIFRR